MTKQLINDLYLDIASQPVYKGVYTSLKTLCQANADTLGRSVKILKGQLTQTFRIQGKDEIIVNCSQLEMVGP